METIISALIEQCEELFKTFGRAFFRKDIELLYEVVTEDFVWDAHEAGGLVKKVTGRQAVAAHMAGQSTRLENIRFHDVVYHHTDEVSFMTFRLTANNVDRGEAIVKFRVKVTTQV